MRLNHLHKHICNICFILFPFVLLNAQNQIDSIPSVQPETDLIDVMRKLFKATPDTVIRSSKPSISILPVVGYNPSFGGLIGFNSVMGKQYGEPSNTDYSVFNLLFSYSSSKVITLQSRHNVFRPGNIWNFQGNWQLSFYGLVDHGLGTGNTDFCYVENDENDIPLHKNDSIFPIRYNYLRLSEKIYYEFLKNFYIGAGINLNFYGDIDDLNLSDTLSTPHFRYSTLNQFNPKHYRVNGLQLAFQYNTRDHTVRSYTGMYFDFDLQLNTKWLGSTQSSATVSYDFRKYFSLSKRNPTHVLAFWHWATYEISGTRPYLNLPYTGSDTYNRSGRGYTIGYFRGPSYAYFETEYRYPILGNNLISGVVFMNFQTAGNDDGTSVYQAWNIGGGAGLRILFQKRSRSALCIDFARGNCGSKGIFFGLNEVF